MKIPSIYRVIDILFIAIASSLLTGSLLFVDCEKRMSSLRCEAVDHGFAHWRVTSNETGKTEFTWGSRDSVFDQLQQKLVDRFADSPQ
jgi:hypothetical protein